MNPIEKRAAISLAGVFSVRLLGLFMVYPIFADYARHLPGASASTIGLALGIYGLSQGLLQIPFGLASDRVGRKRMIVLGLILFAIGSVIAANAGSIWGMVLGRVIQGAGAVGSVILALVADLTSEESRTKAMATVGITIGFSFMVAVVAGPIFASRLGLSGIFWLMAGLALVGIAITLFVVPTPPVSGVHHRDAEAVPALLGSMLRNPDLLRLDFSIFALHAILTSSFLVMPTLLDSALGITTHGQWMVYLPVFAISVVVMIPAIIVAEKHRKMKQVVVASVAAMAASQAALFFDAANAIALLAAVTIFFVGFNIMEASLPSLVTKTAPAGAKGTASGIYSSSQFIGIFFGGLAGGWAHHGYGDTGVFALSTAIGVVWLVVMATMREPRYLSSRLVKVGPGVAADTLAGRLREVPGVAEATVVAEEGVAYLKVDSRTYDPAAAEALALSA
ncbi:MFS transporter [Tsuneonella mangrovi]|uniref:MFS transporter n=1 Tax=Tsuneonella mangrovi TaxID=1982042 RepID=UPI000BA226DC|nr:MFS transporter [Tsuneonella mangrovi]